MDKEGEKTCNENIYNKIIIENFPNLEKEMIIQV
jgi:hypothetical protein